MDFEIRRLCRMRDEIEHEITAIEHIDRMKKSDWDRFNQLNKELKDILNEIDQIRQF